MFVSIFSRHQLIQIANKFPLPTVEVSESSNNIVKNIQTKRIVYIFGELDSDQDGLISPTKVSIDMLPPDVLEVIMPILF
jgi:hypothetical protein